MFLSNRAENILLGLVFRKKNLCSGWDIFEDFRLGAFHQHVLQNASLLSCGASVPNTTGHGVLEHFDFLHSHAREIIKNLSQRLFRSSSQINDNLRLDSHEIFVSL